MSEDKRLDRIEDKLDRVAEAVISLARMEERMITLFKRMDHYDVEQNKVRNKVDLIEKNLSSHGVTIKAIERIFWICITAALGIYIKAKM